MTGDPIPTRRRAGATSARTRHVQGTATALQPRAALAVLMALVVGWPACSAETATPDPSVVADVVTEDQGPADTPPGAYLEVSPAPPRPAHATYLVSEMAFTFEEPEGVAPGFDLDGAVSMGNDGTGCEVEDQTAPDGTPGIDNQLARFMPFIEAAGINQLEEYLQFAVLEGGIMMLAVVEGLDDPVNDDDVRLIIVRGTGRPLVDLGNRVEAWQTIGLAEEDPVLGISTQAAVIDGVVVGQFDSLRLPALLFDVFVDLHLTFGRFSFPIAFDDARSGFGSGAVTLTQILEIIDKTPSGNLGDVIASLGPSLADLDVDGDTECDALSAVLEVGVVPAFIAEGQLEALAPLLSE